MFGLEGSGFIIAISVSLLLIGAVVYYFNTRVASLEKALVRQNQVLADFIQNVKATHMENRAMQNQEMEGNGATFEAVQAAKNYYSNTIPHDKVPVSENDFGADEEETIENSDDSDDSDEESDLDSELDSDDEDVDSNEVESLDPELLNVHVTTHPHAMLGGMIIDMTGPGPVEVSHKESSSKVIELLGDDEDDDDDKSDHLTPVEIKEEPVDSAEPKIIKLSEVKDLDSVSSSLGSSLGDDDDDDEDDGITLDSKQETLVADFSKLKVKNLKEIAAKKGIKNASKMKKAELVSALEANK
jgi:hypothetical protein